MEIPCIVFQGDNFRRIFLKDMDRIELAVSRLNWHAPVNEEKNILLP